MFNPYRVIIGSQNHWVADCIGELYKNLHVPIIKTDPVTSEIIKYTSNCWLATQISYWNEILQVCNSHHINPQTVANACRLDKRISSYGTSMLGTPFKGMCLPKDIKMLIKICNQKKIKPTLLKAVLKVNEGMD